MSKEIKHDPDMCECSKCIEERNTRPDPPRCKTCEDGGLVPAEDGITSDEDGEFFKPCPDCPPRCKTCGGSGEVDDALRSVRAGIDINKPCPDCQPKPAKFVKKLPFPLNKCFTEGLFNGIAKVTLKNGDYAVHPKALEQLETEFIKARGMLDRLERENNGFRKDVEEAHAVMIKAKKEFADLRVRLTTAEQEIERLKKEKRILVFFVEWAGSCKPENTMDWFVEFRKRVGMLKNIEAEQAIKEQEHGK